MPYLPPRNILARLIRFLTFVDLPIRRKFLLFAMGTLFWFLALAGVVYVALFQIQSKYSKIVQDTIPHDRIMQKVTRDLQVLSADASSIARSAGAAEVQARAEVARLRIKDVRGYLTALALGGEVNDYSRDTGKLLETFKTSSIGDDPVSIGLLRELGDLCDELSKQFDRYVNVQAARFQGSAPPADVVHAQEGFEQLLNTAIAKTQDFAAKTTSRYKAYSADIRQTIKSTAITVAVVLLIASTLLLVFSRWIAQAISQPVSAIIRQIHSLASGDVDLTKRICVTSDDEIGRLSDEFNQVMETVHGMTTFKKVIEEDDALEDIYSRLGEVFRNLGIEQYMIYEISNSKKEMKAVYPMVFSNKELFCNPDILTNSTLCRACKTGHQISSVSYPRMCKQFMSESGKEHICLPLIIGGRAGGVVQFVFDHRQDGSMDVETIHSQLFKAENYITQSLSVIEAKRLMNTLKESALMDPLTGLYNRRFLQEHTQHILAGVQRRGKSVGLLMCDLDYFKQVNDELGHDAGDQVLKETCAIIQKTVRASDFVIRFGGEEFLVLLTDINEGEADLISEKIRSNVEANKIKLGGQTIQKTISIGVAEYPTDSEGFWQTIKFADVALYQAKEQGRNRAVRFSQSMWSATQF